MSTSPARESVELAFERIAALDDPAVVIASLPTDELRRLADAIDARPAVEVPLRGTTFAVKDNIDVLGVATTAACPPFSHEPERSATVVERLVAAGAIPVAKTNLDQFATGLVGTRSPYGTPRNPFDRALVPGGSSSGSAVAVARGVVPFALGTDTAGSGRVPAAMCGLVGIKPTRGRLSCAGVLPAVRSIDCVSIFATSVADGMRVVSIAAGHDAGDPYSRRGPAAAPRAISRVGVPDPEVLRELGVDDDIVAELFRSVRALPDLGCTPVPVDLTDLFAIGDELYGGPWVAERVAAFGRLLDEYGADHGVDPIVRRIVESGSAYSAVDAHRARYRLAELRARVDDLFTTVDALLLPTVPGRPTVADVAADPFGVNAALGRFTTFTNLADLCAVTFPVGRGARRMVPPSSLVPPPSLSLHAPAWCDEGIAAVADALMRGVAAEATPTGWVRLAVAGAHLRGQPLEHQLLDRSAVFVATTSTAPRYRLHALDGTTPPKPGLVRDDDGRSIEVDVWALHPAAFGDFVREVPAPLCIGSVELSDSSIVSGFLCEPWGLRDATDITAYGGWRAYRDSGSTAAAS